MTVYEVCVNVDCSFDLYVYYIQYLTSFFAWERERTYIHNKRDWKSSKVLARYRLKRKKYSVKCFGSPTLKMKHDSEIVRVQQE